MSFAFLLISCSFEDPGCLEPNLRLWCTDDAAGGDTPCDEPENDPDYRCGPYDVTTDNRGFSGQSHYFDHDSGKHVASVFWQDVNTRCGGFETWYGRRVACEPTCQYASANGLYEDYELPECD